MTVKIQTYSELASLVSAFTNGQLNLLLVQSKGGLGKTTSTRKALQDKKHLYLNGHLTPLEMYKQLYHHRDELIVFDDIDMLLRNPRSLSLLKQVCDTRNEKEVQYHSTAGSSVDVPQSFTTTSKVIVLTNQLRKGRGEDMQAFLTRGLHVLFSPTPKEVYKVLESFAKDKEILSWFNFHLHKLKQLDLRKYVLAVELKNAFLDWNKYVSEELGLDWRLWEARYVREKRLPYPQQLRLWEARTGLKSTTYKNTINKIGQYTK